MFGILIVMECCAVSLEKIDVDQLQVGHYIRLDGSWTDCPFMFRSFKIKTEKQIRLIKGLGVELILYDPSRSDIKVSQPVQATPEIASVDSDEEVQEENTELLIEEAFQEKTKRIKLLKERRVSLNRCEKAFTESVGAVKNLVSSFQARPKESLAIAETLVEDIVGDILKDQNSTMQLVNMKGQEEGSYFHIINVTMLSLIIGKQLGLSEEEMNYLGVGAMLHDFGMLKVPTKISRKTSAFTAVEKKVYELHPRYGAEIVRKLDQLPKAVIQIIEQHHEYEDGTGYPYQLTSEKIGKLSKIVVVATAYDDLCNCPRNKKLLTPYEAMSLMFSQTKFDKKILSIFINKLGVYPPGTLVRLSNDLVAGVTAVNHDDLLNPHVVVYDEDIPKEEAAIIDLSEEDVTIKETIRRNEVSANVLSYLNFGDSINYFIDPGN